jgi:ribosomal protein S4
MFRKAGKLTGDLGTNYCHFLECRTITMIYRTNFLANIFNCIMFVKRKRLFVNDSPLSYINAVISVNSIIRPAIIWLP